MAKSTISIVIPLRRSWISVGHFCEGKERNEVSQKENLFLTHLSIQGLTMTLRIDQLHSCNDARSIVHKKKTA